MNSTDLAIALAVFGVVLASVFSPLIVALTLSVRGGSSVPRRAAFVLVATSLAYGAALFAWLIVAVPVRLFATYVLPQLGLAFPSTRSWELLWFMPLYRIGEFPQYIFPVLLLALACTTVISLWRRWPLIVHAAKGVKDI